MLLQNATHVLVAATALGIPLALLDGGQLFPAHLSIQQNSTHAIQAIYLLHNCCNLTFQYTEISLMAILTDCLPRFRRTSVKEVQRR